MKKIILTVAAVFAFGFANAQEKQETNEGFAKGDVFVTGGFAIRSANNKNTDTKSNSFEIAPQVNYFVSENISIGARIGYSSMKQKTAGIDTQDDSAVAFGVLGRYYFTPTAKFSLFGQLATEYVSFTDNLGTPNLKVNGFGAGLGLGMNYFVSSNFAIEANFAALEYASAKADVTGAKNNSNFAVGIDLSAISFGLNYKF
jgi:outer membrane protein